MTALLASLLLSTAMAASDCDDAEPQRQAAAQALVFKDLATAERLLGAMDSLAFHCPRVSLEFARLYWAKGDLRRADVYSDLAATPGDDAGALVLRAQVLSATGRRGQATGLLEKAVRIAPSHAEAHFELGRTYDAAKKSMEAASEFELASKLKPDDPQAFDYLALILERLGETERAEAAYRQGLAVNQGARFDRFLDYNYGRLLFKLNRLEESRLHLDRALELAPQVRAVHYDHAKLNLRLGQAAAARQDAEKALSLADPGGFILDLQIYNLLTAITTKLGDVEGARKYAGLSSATHVPLRSRERD